jgi:hypothetical protein
MPSVYNYFAAALLPEAFATIKPEKPMETPTTATKLTIKQAILTLILQAVYFIMRPYLNSQNPKHAGMLMEIERLLDEADTITGDYIDVITRRASHLDKTDQLMLIDTIDRRGAVCNWREEDPDNAVYSGSCGVCWEFEYAPDREAKDINYCIQCGRRLVFVEPEPAAPVEEEA